MQVDSADAKHFSRPFNVSTVLLLFTAAAIFIWEMRSPILQMDDAFISYRYAQNWVAGHGLVFNVGERVEGYTNFLWVLLIALGMKLGFSAPIFGHWLCVVTGTLLLFANYLYCAVLLPRSARLLAALAPLLLLSLNTFVLWTSSGLEPGFFAALVVLALWASTVGRHWAACSFCCLATLTRPEGVLVAALLLNMPWLRAALRSSKYKWRETFTALLPALCFGIFVGLFTLFRWFYYGDVVPNTFYAKVGGIPFWWGTFYLQQFALDGPVFLLLGTLLAAIWVPRFRLGFALLLFFVVYILWVRGDVFRGGRFMLPVLPVLVAGSLLAIHATYARGHRVLLWLCLAMLPLAVFFSLYVEPPALFAKVSDFKFVHQAGFPYSFKRPNHRVHDVMHLDDALAVRLPLVRQAQPPIHLIASVGIGKLAYYGGDFEILDLVGLTDKTIAKSTRLPPKDAFLIPGHQRTDPDYVFSRKPDLIDISKKDAPILVLPAIRDLWNDARLARDYHWDDGLGGYRRNE